MTWADEGAQMVAEGVTSAVTVDNPRSFACRGKGRGTRPTTETCLGKVCLRGHDNGSGRSVRTRLGRHCVECIRLHSLAASAERNRKLIAARKVIGSEAYWKNREAAWRHQGIALADGSPLDRETYKAVLTFQGRRCAVCGVEFALSSVVVCADHDHASGEFRGVVCGGLRTGCNTHSIARVETGMGIRRRDPHTDEDVARLTAVVWDYLSNPPYRRWLRAGSPRP